MKSHDTPEPAYRALLRQAATDISSVQDRMAVLTLHEADGSEYTVPLAATWNPLPGRPGVEIYHVPHPDGTAGLFMTCFRVAPGSEYTGSHIEESRLIELLSGALSCNGHELKPGDFCWIAPRESTSWYSTPGAVGVVLYNAPNPATK